MWRSLGIVFLLFAIVVVAGVATKDNKNEAALKEDLSPRVGTWVVLGQAGLGCLDIENFKLFMKAVTTKDDDAASMMALSGRCRIFDAGTELWVAKASVWDFALQMRPKGVIDQYWMAEGYKYRPVS